LARNREGQRGVFSIPLVQPTITGIDRRDLRSFVAKGLAESPQGAIEKFEREVAASLGVAGAVAVSSGTAALHLALMALGIGERDEVIVPTYTCVSLLHAVHACGARAVPVDNEVSLEDYQLAPTLKQIERGVTRRTKAVIAVHTFGSVARVVSESRLGVPMIEDFTLSLGARLRGRLVGSWGNLAVASLHASKMISAGQGGIVASQDKRLLEKVRELSSFEGKVIGWRRMSESRLRGTYTQALNYQMSGLQATLALSQWKQLPRFIKRRLQLARRYSETFAKLGISCPSVPEDGSNVFYRYLISVPGKVNRLIDAMAREDVELGRGVFPPLHLLLGLSDKQFSGAMECAGSIISVPLYPSLSDAAATRLLDSVGRHLTQWAK
jgi:perosamine synthetase